MCVTPFVAVVVVVCVWSTLVLCVAVLLRILKDNVGKELSIIDLSLVRGGSWCPVQVTGWCDLQHSAGGCVQWVGWIIRG